MVQLAIDGGFGTRRYGLRKGHGRFERELRMGEGESERGGTDASFPFLSAIPARSHVFWVYVVFSLPYL
jgi:hypothetical protein